MLSRIASCGPVPPLLFQLVGLVCLLLGVFLLAGGAGFFGVDFWVGLLLLASTTLGALSAMRGQSLGWGLAVAVPAAVVLAFHLAMNLGFF